MNSFLLLILLVIGWGSRQGPAVRATGAIRPRALQTGDDSSVCGSLTPTGDFGVLSGSTTQLEFLYEIEYDRFEYRIGEILEQLEVQIVAHLLPVIFGVDCFGLNRDGSMEKYIGISAKPGDVPLDSSSCQNPVVRDGNVCQKMSGHITLYRKAPALSSTLVSLKNAVQTGMDNGIFDGIGGATRVSSLKDFVPKTNATTCALSADGSFGDVSSTDRHTIHFGYELELFQQTQRIESILQKIESTLTTRLLPRLFPLLCLDIPVRRRRLQSLLGIASSPPDLPEDRLACQPIFDASNLCRTIHGQLTIFLSDSADNAEKTKQQVEAHIQTLINTDSEVRSADASIIDVRYFLYDLSTADDTESSSDSVPGLEADASKLDVWVIILIALAVLLCLGTIALFVFMSARGDGSQEKRTRASHDVKQTNGKGQHEEKDAPPEAPISSATGDNPLETIPCTPRTSKKGTVGQSHGPQTPRTPSTLQNHQPPRTPRSVPTNTCVYGQSPRQKGATAYEPQSVPTSRAHTAVRASQLPRPPIATPQPRTNTTHPQSAGYAQVQKGRMSPTRSLASHGIPSHISTSPRHTPRATMARSAHAARTSSSPYRQPVRPNSDHVVYYAASPDGKRLYISPRHAAATKRPEQDKHQDEKLNQQDTNQANTTTVALPDAPLLED